MDNTPTPVSEIIAPTPVPGAITPPTTQGASASHPSKIPRWAQILLSCVVVIAILLSALWYGTKKYYQVKPLTVYIGAEGEQSPFTETTSSSTQNQNYFTAGNISSDYDLSSFTISEQDCYLDSVISQDNKLSTTTLSNLRNELCVLFEKRGKAAITYPTKIIFNNDEAVAVGIITIPGHTFLTYFSIDDDGEGAHTLTLKSANLLKITTVSKIGQGTIKNKARESIIVEVTGADASGNEIHEYFKKISIRHVGYSFVEIIKNSDSTFSDIVSDRFWNDVARITFLTPYSSYSSQQIGDRNFGIEYSNGISPVYHKSGCGLEDSYGDMAFHINDYNATISINFGFYPTLNITTAETGYNPDQWGTILEKISMADFISSIQKNKALRSNSLTEMMTISGYHVKHTGPITPERSCQGYYDEKASFDIYQATKNGAVITFTVFNMSGARNNLEDTQRLISQVLTTLTFSKR